MKKTLENKIAGLILLLTTIQLNPSYWHRVTEWHSFIAPATNNLKVNSKRLNSKADWKNDLGTQDRYQEKIIGKNLTFDLEFPIVPNNNPEKSYWYLQSDDAYCENLEGGKFKYGTPQIRLRSNEINNICGLSFLGKVTKTKNIGPDDDNHFSIFFHSQKCYNGGPEYGFVFYENRVEGAFYLCGNCNQVDANLYNQSQLQTWWDYPGPQSSNKGPYGRAVSSTQWKEVAEALETPWVERYYSVKVKQDGNFLIEITDPKTWKKVSCLITKPDDFPNVYGKTGYITINAKRLEKRKSTTVMKNFELREISVWKN